jgi:uncharacterized protein
MKRTLAALALCLLSAGVAQAADAPASEASIRALLETMHASKMLDSMWDQMQPMMKSAMQEATAGQSLNATQVAIRDDMSAKFAAAYKETMTWAKMEPVMIRVYQKNLTQSEVEAMTAFYRTPAGQSVMVKLPAIMQSSIQEMQVPMRELIPKFQAIARDAAERIRQAGSESADKPKG